MPLNFPEPFFLPRVLTTDHPYVEYKHYPVLNFAANFFYLDRTQDLNLQRLVYSHADEIIVDPRTAVFQFGGHTDKPTYEKLPYRISSGSVLSISDFDATFYRDYVRKVIEEELKREVTILVPPYFLSSGPSDPWFNVGVRCCEITRDLYPDRNILMFLLIKGRILLRQSELEVLIRTLESLDVDGFYILVSDLDEGRISSSHLNSFISLVKELSSRRRVVIPGQVGRLGLVLVASGAAGYGAGFEKLDSFSEAHLGIEGGGGGRTTRYYIHTALLHIYSRKADAIVSDNSTSPEYPCNCSHCDGRLPTEIASKERTLHYIDHRFKELKELRRVQKSQRLNHVEGLLSSSIELCLKAEGELASSVFGPERFRQTDYEHLVALRDAVHNAQLE